MPINILMPALSPTMTEGKLSRWLKKTGDDVKPGDVIAEIETDKAMMEVEAVDEGKIGAIRVAEGTEGVAVNSIIAVMLSEGETDSDIAKADEVPVVKVLKETVQAAAPLAAPRPLGEGWVERKAGRIVASPLAKRIANERHIDLSRVTGTGPNGRIVLADLNNFHKAPQMDAPRTAPAAPDAKKLADLLGMKYTAQANSTVRKTIAKRLTEAKQSVPHFYLTIDCDIGALMVLRGKMNEEFTAKNEHIKLSVNDFVIRASALALKHVPAANSSWADSEILFYSSSDISVAVATDNGLITPIIKAAEEKSVATISKEMKDLGLRARAGKLKPEEFQGGTFSISNLGMFGIREFAAIINPPQACILAVGAGEQRAVVRNGQLEIATMMTCTLSVDHRAVDGAVGAEYLAAFRKLIEEPSQL